MCKHEKWTALILIASLILGLTVVSCRTPAGRSTGQVIDDGTITTEVKAKLLEQSMLKGMAISVQTFEGKVTLIGAVDTPEQKSAAEQTARSVKGVTGVNNNLEIKKK